MDLAADKRRLVIAIAITGACGLIALSAGIGALAFNVDWLNWVFGAALIAGFAAQFWFMWAFLKSRSQP
jgi:hypothetical protein